MQTKNRTISTILQRIRWCNEDKVALAFHLGSELAYHREFDVSWGRWRKVCADMSAPDSERDEIWTGTIQPNIPRHAEFCESDELARQ